MGGEGAECGGFITCVALLETSLLDKEAQARALGVSQHCIEKAWKFFGYRKLSPGTAAAVSAGEHMFDEGIMKEHGYEKDNGVSVFAWFALLDDEKKTLVNNKTAQNRREYAKKKSTPTGVLNDKGEEVMKAQLQWEKKKKRNEEFIRSQRIQPPPLRMNANKCSICPTETSYGWTTAPDALYFVKTLFEKDKLKEHPSREEANGYLTKKKRRHLKDENVKLRSTDILCCRCWIKCRRAAVARIEELLQAQKKI